MIAITEYLSTKGKNPYFIFPSIPKFDDVINFLKKHGFKEVIHNDIDKLEGLYDAAKNGDCPVFMTCKLYNGKDLDPNFKDVHWLRFCKNGNINIDNPILFCYLTPDGSIPNLTRDEIDFIGYNITTATKYKTFEEFRNVVNSLYNWKNI